MTRCDNCGELRSDCLPGRRGTGDSSNCLDCYAADLDHGVRHGLCSPALRDALVTLARAEDWGRPESDLLALEARADAIEADDDRYGDAVETW